jgi:DNA-binding MarR family transcriptional regulator
VRKKPDARRMEAWQALLFGHAALVRRLDHELQESADMPLQWYEVLLRLYRAPHHRLRMQELGQSLFFTPSGVTRVVDRLEEVGLVERQKCPADRRGTYAALTDDGLARFREAGPVHLRGIEEHFGSLVGDDEADAISAALGRIIEALNA